MNSTLITIIAALITTSPSIVAIFANKKIKKQNTLMEEVNLTIAELKEDSQKRDTEIIQSIKEDRLMDDKRWLLDFLTRVQNKEVMSEEQKQMAYETKERYNKNGGDSYIDDLWDKCKSKSLF